MSNDDTHEDELGVDEFLGHKTNGGGASVLTGWKQNDSHSVDVWHHTKAPIAVSVWYHRAPCVIDVENRATGEKENKTISIRLGCWEPEANLRVQYKRDRDTGVRLTPPEKCGQCKFLEWVRTEVLEERLNWLEPVFKWQGEQDEKATIVRAAHIYNGFSGDKDRFSDEQLEEMKKYKVFRGDAWKLNYFPKAHYIFRVVDDAHPEKGVQVTIEPALLGDKVKGVIGEMREKWGADEGNPLKSPYAIRWRNLPDEKEFGKRYKATALTEGKLKVDITPEIQRLITKTDPPNVDAFKRRFNALQWRASMEAACLIDVPWDDLYGDTAYGDDDKGQSAETEPPKVGDAAKGRSQGQVARAPAPPPPDEEEEGELFDCDVTGCSGVMKATDTKCPKCGKVYEVEGAPTPPPPSEPSPPPPRKKRSELAKPEPEAAKPASAHARGQRTQTAPNHAKASATASTGAAKGTLAKPPPARRAAPPPPPAEEESGEGQGGNDDDIPF